MSESLIIAIAKAAIMESMAKMRNPGISYNELLELSEIIIEAGETIKEAATDKILAEIKTPIGNGCIRGEKCSEMVICSEEPTDGFYPVNEETTYERDQTVASMTDPFAFIDRMK